MIPLRQQRPCLLLLTKTTQKSSSFRRCFVNALFLEEASLHNQRRRNCHHHHHHQMGMLTRSRIHRSLDQRIREMTLKAVSQRVEDCCDSTSSSSHLTKSHKEKEKDEKAVKREFFEGVLKQLSYYQQDETSVLVEGEGKRKMKSCSETSISLCEDWFYHNSSDSFFSSSQQKLPPEIQAAFDQRWMEAHWKEYLQCSPTTYSDHDATIFKEEEKGCSRQRFQRYCQQKSVFIIIDVVMRLAVEGGLVFIPQGDASHIEEWCEVLHLWIRALLRVMLPLSLVTINDDGEKKQIVSSTSSSFQQFTLHFVQLLLLEMWKGTLEIEHRRTTQSVNSGKDPTEINKDSNDTATYCHRSSAAILFSSDAALFHKIHCQLEVDNEKASRMSCFSSHNSDDLGSIHKKNGLLPPLHELLTSSLSSDFFLSLFPKFKEAVLVDFFKLFSPLSSSLPLSMTTLKSEEERKAQRSTSCELLKKFVRQYQQVCWEEFIPFIHHQRNGRDDDLKKNPIHHPRSSKRSGSAFSGESTLGVLISSELLFQDDVLFKNTSERELDVISQQLSRIGQNSSEKNVM